MEETGNGVRKPSSSPTRSSSAQPPRPTIPRWLILDRIVHRSSRTRRSGVVSDDSTASALAHDCIGRPVRASLRIASPPAISRLYLHLTGLPPIEFAEPKAIAADGGSILFRMRVPFEDPDSWSRLIFFPIDYFVYSSGDGGSSPAPARLVRLPPCFEGGHSNPKIDKYFEPYRVHQQRTMLDEEMGILCHGDHGEFTVADITDRDRRAVDLCLLHHPPPPPRSAAAAAITDLQWSVKRLEVPDDMNINLSTWRNDVAVPVGGRRLCWVDYYQGLLFIDILTALTLTESNNRNSQQDHDDHQRQKLMQFIPLPRQALKHRRHYIDGGEPDPFRSVSVTDDGNIKLVCILPTKQQPSPPSPSFTITAWTLHDDVEWRKDVETRMGHTEFFGLLLGHSLPRVQPRFPTVSLVDPDVICFLLQDEDRDVFWMVEVDMRNKKLLSSALYINEEEEDGYPAKRERRNWFFGHNFIRSEFSSFLSEDAITSLELSEKMQEAKKGRVMQKIGLEEKLKK